MKSSNRKIALGFAQWGKKSVSTSQMCELVRVAVQEYKINEIDCAPHYGNGTQESVLGVALFNIDDKPSISSKVGRVICPNISSENSNGFSTASPFAQRFDYTETGILESFKQSLLRLHTSIDTLYLHDLDPSTHGNAFDSRMLDFTTTGYQALLNLKKDKFIKHIGIGSNDYASCMRLLSIDNFKIDRIMLAGCYNLLSLNTLKDFFSLCAEKKVDVYLAAPYAGGLLSGETNNLYYRYNQASPELLNRIKDIEKVACDFGVSVPHAALQYVLMHPNAKKVVVGPRTTDELALTIRYANQAIPLQFWETLKQQNLIPKDAPVAVPKRQHSVFWPYSTVAEPQSSTLNMKLQGGIRAKL